MTSAGYGELYPKTLFGRIVGAAICLWGVLIISFFVVTVSDMLEFTENEENSYNLILKLYYKTELKKSAIGVLTASFTHRKAKKADPSNTRLLLSHFRSYRSALLTFNKTSRLVRSQSTQNGKELDVVQTILENIMQHVDEMKENHF